MGFRGGLRPSPSRGLSHPQLPQRWLGTVAHHRADDSVAPPIPQVGKAGVILGRTRSGGTPQRGWGMSKIPSRLSWTRGFSHSYVLKSYRPATRSFFVFVYSKRLLTSGERWTKIEEVAAKLLVAICGGLLAVGVAELEHWNAPAQSRSVCEEEGRVL